MTSDPTDPANWPPLAADQPPFWLFIGAKLISVARERVEAELVARPELLNRNGVLHGGAILSVADNIGGTCAFINLREGQGTTTLESKTNFLRAVKPGDTLRFVCTPLHSGRKTMICQTNVYRSDGKLAAVVTQTQMLLEKDE